MSLESIIDKIRINFYAEVVAVGSTLTAIYNVRTSEDVDIKYELISLGFCLGVCLGVSLSLSLLQNKKYDSLVGALTRKGYDERLCELYMDHFCGRSVVKAALKRTGNFDHYGDLKNKYPITRII